MVQPIVFDVFFLKFGSSKKVRAPVLLSVQSELPHFGAFAELGPHAFDCWKRELPDFCVLKVRAPMLVCVFKITAPILYPFEVRTPMPFRV